MILRTTMAGLLASVALSGPALAQTVTQQPMQPGSTAPMIQPGQGAQQGMTGHSMQQGAMRPIASPQPNQMLSSDLRGTTVYGANNENIGPINDLLLDRDGRVAAVIVGVGGFLGIGQKDVAVPYQALEIMAGDRAAAMGSGGADTSATGTVNRGTGMTSAGAGATGTGATGLTGMGTGMATSGVGPAGTGPTATGGGMGAGAGTAPGSVGNTGANALNPQGGMAQQGAERVATINPQRVVLRGMTRSDLENAPAFRSDGRGAR